MAVGAGEFEVPLFSQIMDNLWTGCSPSEFPDNWAVSVPEVKWLYEEQSDPDSTLVVMTSRFDAILNLYPWAPYIVPEGIEYQEAELLDSHDKPLKEDIDPLALKVVVWLNEDKKVLVHCQAGLNRSALVAARVLMLKDAYTADEAITIVREARSPVCLCNQGFEDWLRSL